MCTLKMSLNQKYRLDAYRVFITGTKKSLFAKGPKDLPTAFALAQDVESNHELYQFALNYSRSLGDGGQKAEENRKYEIGIVMLPNKSKTFILEISRVYPTMPTKQVHQFKRQFSYKIRTYLCEPYEQVRTKLGSHRYRIRLACRYNAIFNQPNHKTRQRAHADGKDYEQQAETAVEDIEDK